MRHAIPVPDVHPTHDRYSHLMAVGDLLFVSGQVAKDPDDRIVGVGDVVAQTRQVFDNMQRVLVAASASLDDVVSITVYLTDLSYRDDFGRVRAEYLRQPLPTSTLVVIDSLVSPELLVEVSAIAVRPR